MNISHISHITYITFTIYTGTNINIAQKGILQSFSKQ